MSVAQLRQPKAEKHAQKTGPEGLDERSPIAST
jgi:hypothetical protein